MKKMNVGRFIIVLLIVFLLVIFFMSRNKSSNATIKLLGNDEIVVHKNEQFKDPGYEIINDNNGCYVDLDGYVNTNKVGVYPIYYMLYNNSGELITKALRQVIVLEDNASNVRMSLNGDEEEFFFVGDYVDHGVLVYRSGVDVSNEVRIINNVDENTVGRYEVKYQIKDNGIDKEVTRFVNIIDCYIENFINTFDKTIDLFIDCDEYSYTLLPNGKKEYSMTVTYPYNKIGEYVFKIYLRSGSSKTYKVKVNEIT